MRVSNILSALLFGITVVSAVPTGEANLLEARSLDVEIKRAPPKREVCPASDNGENRNYAEHTYTNNQLTAALRKAATLQADDKQIGANKYPHAFGNSEKLEFDCGKQKQEFPLQLDGKTYSGGDTKMQPDRLVYEWSETKTALQVKFCGVIRHGPAAFINCES